MIDALHAARHGTSRRLRSQSHGHRLRQPVVVRHPDLGRALAVQPFLRHRLAQAFDRRRESRAAGAGRPLRPSRRARRTGRRLRGAGRRAHAALFRPSLSVDAAVVRHGARSGGAIRAGRNGVRAARAGRLVRRAARPAARRRQARRTARTRDRAAARAGRTPVAPTRRSRARSAMRAPRSRTIRGGSTRWSRRNITGPRTGASPRTRSTTGASSTSTIWPACGSRTPRCSRARTRWCSR